MAEWSLIRFNDFFKPNLHNFLSKIHTQSTCSGRKENWCASAHNLTSVSISLMLLEMEMPCERERHVYHVTLNTSQRVFISLAQLSVAMNSLKYRLKFTCPNEGMIFKDNGCCWQTMRTENQYSKEIIVMLQVTSERWNSIRLMNFFSIFLWNLICWSMPPTHCLRESKDSYEI